MRFSLVSAEYSAFIRRCALRALALLACVMVLPACPSQAAQVDLSLNLFYNNPAIPASGGTWQVAVKTDEFGLEGLNLFVEDIIVDAGTLDILAPSGQVNGNENAGFATLAIATQIDHINIVIAQATRGNSMGNETVFYGVGSIDDPEGGAPNYPDQLVDFPDATAIGPSLTTLANLNNIPWATTDPLGDPTWDTAVLLLSGSFAPGLTPSFFSDATRQTQATVFTSVPINASTVGSSSDFETTVVTTIVRSDLDLIDGDFNADGTVDASDYTLWRDTLGQMVPAGTAADGDNSGIIDAGDYLVWKTNFGTTAGAGAGSLAASNVPEPQTLLLAGFAAIAFVISGPIRARKKARRTTDKNIFGEKTLTRGKTA